jgi:hypothetical protein
LTYELFFRTGPDCDEFHTLETVPGVPARTVFERPHDFRRKRLKKELLIIIGVALATVAALTYKLASAKAPPKLDLARAAVPAEPGKEAGSHRTLFVGALSAGADIAERIAGYGPLLSSADRVVAALAAPLRSDGAKALADAKVGAVSLADPGMARDGAEGVATTVRSLDAASIAWFGAGRGEDAAVRAEVLEEKLGDATFRLAIIGASVAAPRLAAAPAADAGADGAGDDPPWTLSSLDVDRLSARISAIKAEDPSTTVVVLPAWGKPFRWVDADQRTAGAALAEAGADFVIGHGARMMQQVEKVNGAWLLYGIGDFVPVDDRKPPASGTAVPLGSAVALDAVAKGGRIEVRAKLYPIAFESRDGRRDGRLASVTEVGEFMWRVTLEALDFAPKVKRSLFIGRDEVGRFIELKGDV